MDELQEIKEQMQQLRQENAQQNAFIREMSEVMLALDRRMQQYESLLLNIDRSVIHARRASYVLENYYTHIVLGNQKQETNQRFCGKGVVYSAIIGGYDEIQEIGCKSPELDYILFTDDPTIQSETWEVRVVEKPETLSNVEFARWLKIMGHLCLPDYAYTIWVDGKLEITDDLRGFVDRYGGQAPILAFPHYQHDCVYLEEALCEEAGRGNIIDMRRQMAFYRQEGYPAHHGMIDSCVLVREHRNPDVVRTMEKWWEQIQTFSYRDQLGFGYACWKTDMVYDLVPLYCYENAFFKMHDHSA